MLNRVSDVNRGRIPIPMSLKLRSKMFRDFTSPSGSRLTRAMRDRACSIRPPAVIECLHQRINIDLDIAGPQRFDQLLPRGDAEISVGAMPSEVASGSAKDSSPIIRSNSTNSESPTRQAAKCIRLPRPQDW